ncbi:hypothetical protein [Pectobacterium brasiliense]|uniref:hypothetical protein n=1 Tax=Pectobacterium brasiliense TaxID=180957 RepID=UPI0025A2F1FF|nr:hypothetical protein [Pectobacterium brasiliense]WJM80425.1 hypothetical protein QTI90_19450 [Pectobacterium brasiliense]
MFRAETATTSACGWPPGLCSSEQRGAQGCALCCQPRCSFPGSYGVAALPGGAGSGVDPRPTSTPKQKPFLRHGAKRLHALPLRLVARGRTALLLPRSPASAPAPVWRGHANLPFPLALCTRASQAAACGLSAARSRRTRAAPANKWRTRHGLPL